MSDKPIAPDWKAVAQVAIQQRDRAEAKANNLELDLVLAQQREAALQARVVELLADIDARGVDKTKERSPAPTAPSTKPARNGLAAVPD